MNDYAVELRGITKIYPGIAAGSAVGSAEKANDNISFGLCKGEILCIAGENGAGKTTLMKILNGLESPGAGTILINGNAVTINSPLDARKLGIGMVHQHFMLFPEYTAAENIVMGMEPRKWGLFFNRAEANAIAAKLIADHHFSVAPDALVKNLSLGEMQQVEICRLLYRNAGIIVLDEPTSVLTEPETSELFKNLKVMAASGKSIFLITHKLQEIKLIADRAAVLRRGKLVGICDKGSIDEYAISRLMLGCDDHSAVSLKNKRNGASSARRGKVIAFDNVTVMRKGQKHPLLDRLSFSVHSGEIVGFTGVGGNGLGVLEAVLGGFLHLEKGKITHNGMDISHYNIRRLRNQGLAYVPGDRMRVGSARNASIDENIIIDRRHEFFHIGFLDRRVMRIFSGGLIRRYAIGCANGDNAVDTLSGGNIQKLILAREIDQLKDYIVFSEPSWGLDIAASEFIQKEIAALRDNGAAIILISTNLDEVISLADRIFVMYRGRAIAEFNNNGDVNKEHIGNCMQGLLPEGLASA